MTQTDVDVLIGLVEPRLEHRIPSGAGRDSVVGVGRLVRLLGSREPRLVGSRRQVGCPGSGQRQTGSMPGEVDDQRQQQVG